MPGGRALAFGLAPPLLGPTRRVKCETRTAP